MFYNYYGKYTIYICPWCKLEFTDFLNYTNHLNNIL